MKLDRFAQEAHCILIKLEMPAIETRDIIGRPRPVATIPVFIQSSAVMQIGEKFDEEFIAAPQCPDRKPVVADPRPMAKPVNAMLIDGKLLLDIGKQAWAIKGGRFHRSCLISWRWRDSF